MRHVVPQNILILSYRQPILPAGTASLIDAEKGPVVSLVTHQGNRYLICAFGLLDEKREALNTPWPLRTHFVVFMGNALQYLSGSLDVQIEAKTRPGQALTIRTTREGEQVSIRRPDNTIANVLAGSSQTAHYGTTDRVGVYTASPTARGSTSYAVNLFSAAEGRIQPNADFAIGGETVKGKSSEQLTNVPLWPWFLLAVLVLLFLEWAVYSKRIMI